jgi:hypothetical protein
LRLVEWGMQLGFCSALASLSVNILVICNPHLQGLGASRERMGGSRWDAPCLKSAAGAASRKHEQQRRSAAGR